MNWRIDKLYSPAVLRVKCTGPFDPADMTEYVAEVSSERSKFPFLPLLIDNRDLVIENMDTRKMVELARVMFEGNAAFSNCRIALLMGSITDFINAWEFGQIVEPVANAQIKIFHELDAALDWLSIPRSSGGTELLPTLLLQFLILGTSLVQG